MSPLGERTTFTNDAAGRRILQQNANGTRASYSYDRADQLLQLFHLKSDNSRYVAESDATNAVNLLYSGEPTAYGSIYSQSSKSVAIWTPREFHADCIGSVRGITDSTAIVTDTCTFAAFGTSVASSGSTVAALKYCGRHGYYADFGTQYYLRATMHDAGLGRFRWNT